MNPNLHEAANIFKSLGWENATPDHIMDLPLGTAEQRKTALAGLKSGDFGEIAQLKENTYGWRSHVDVDEEMLALFAVRVGVDARRAANILRNAGQELLVQVIAERGAKYASDFIKFACVSQRRIWEHSASAFGNTAVRLVDCLNLDVPQSVEYMKDWSVYAAAAMGFKAETLYKETDLPNIEMIEKRFLEHVTTGVAVNSPATGPFGKILPAGVKRGWLTREKAIDLVFSALDASIRPGDRKVWLSVLEELDVSDHTLCSRTQALIPILASGDTVVVTQLAPILIAQAENQLLTEVLMASFSAKTKKAKKLVLKSALNRPRPEDAETLIPWLSMFANDTDKGVASDAERLMKQWGISAETVSEEEVAIQGIWTATPPVWTVPDFEIGEVSPERLTQLAAELVNRAVVIHDVVSERFLAVANAVALHNASAARVSLKGLRRRDSFLSYIENWVKDEVPSYGFDQINKHSGKWEAKEPLAARDYVICLKLGKLPCLLSTPSKEDLSITVSDLTARLALYEEAGIDVLEADLFLALTRLDIKTAMPESIQSLHQLQIPVILQSGKYLLNDAGQAVLQYLDRPIKEPTLMVDKYDHWRKADISISDALPGFPNRFSGYYQFELFSVFPLWGDAALRDVHWGYDVYHEQGLILRQVARHSAPLPPGAAINFLAAQRSVPSDAAEDSMRAVTEAWERGLLRPGIADTDFLDWSTSEPSNLAALSTALEDIARDGLLSIVCPILDALIVASLKAPRLLAGTAELAELIGTFLPEVQFAIEKGLADKTALYLPGIRSLAARSGSSRAVKAAQKITALLPAAPEAISKEEESPSTMEPPFDKVWPVQKEILPPIDDGVSITVDWADLASPKRLFLFTLTLPDRSEHLYQVVNRGWYYDLENEGQCRAYAVSPGTISFAGNEKNQVWLHWDTKLKTMAVCNNRNWKGETDGPLRGAPTPLPASLLTVLIGLLAQDGDAIYFAPRLLREFIESGDINEVVVRKAAQVLLQNSVVSPAKLVRSLEKDIKLLPVLWPMLAESIKSAGEIVMDDSAPPVWVNRILDIALRYAPYLVEAAKRGFITPEDARWTGLSQIALSKAKSTAVVKAKKLLEVLGE